MSAALLDDLLADFTAPACLATAPPTPAKAANSAKSEQPCGREADSAPANGCETLRIGGARGSKFAGIRRHPQQQKAAEREHPRGFSQDSQDSQACPPPCTALEALDLAAVSWTDGDIARFLDRRARLMRWGWPETDAEKLADRLVMRDREADDRVSCTDCTHYRPGRCGNHRRAGLSAADVGRDLAAMPQRCAGFLKAEL